MRKIALFAAAAAAGALGFPAPASAQYYPQPVYGYDPVPVYSPAPRYGYVANSAAIVQNLDARVAGVRARVRDLQVRGAIRWSKARSLDRQALQLQRSIRRSAWNGLSPGEARSLDVRVASLERRVHAELYRPQFRRHAGYRRF